MPKFGNVPKEVPVQRGLDICAPKFKAAVEALVAELGGTYTAFETIRTESRQTYLYGFGRDYDDGRGRVTNAQTALRGWHAYGLACDIVEKDGTPWDAPASFWHLLGTKAKLHGLTWGGEWTKPDLPHVQWGLCPASPTDADRALYATGGMVAVWQKYGADG